MSAQAGILYPAGTPLPSAVSERLGLANDERGPDRYGCFRGDGVVLVHHALHFDRLSALEQQPVRLADGSVLTFDGRLDNREDLFLQLHRFIEPSATDAELVGVAWQQWGRDAFLRLVGDWSVAIWLPHERTVVLARDYMGNRPLYYVRHGDVFAWSTCVQPLVDLFDLYDRLSDPFMAGVLTYGIPAFTTVFDGVLAVPSAHWTELSHEKGIRHQRFWDFSSDIIRYRDERDYEAHLRAAFTDAVKVRLRAKGPTWAHLSGGYDSSSIACVGTHLVKAHAVETPRVRFLSRIYSRSPESDESQYIAAVERWCGQPTMRLDDTGETTMADMASPFVPFGGSPPDSPIMLAVMESGGHAILSGEMGDLVMAKSSPHASALLELLPRLRVRQFMNDLQIWSEGRRRPWWQSLSRIVAPSFPELMVWQDRRKGRHRIAELYRTSPHRPETAFGLGPQLAPHTNVSDVDCDLRRFTPSKRFMARVLYRCAQTSIAQSHGGPVPVRMTYPFAHRPLVEFVLAIPHMAMWKATEVRSLMRRSFSGFLPDAVLTRRGKGNPISAISRMYQPLVQELLAERETWQLVSRGYMRDDVIRGYYTNFVNGSVTNPSRLRVLVALEGWLRGTAARREHPRGLRTGAKALRVVS